MVTGAQDLRRESSEAGIGEAHDVGVRGGGVVDEPEVQLFWDLQLRVRSFPKLWPQILPPEGPGPRGEERGVEGKEL